MIEAPREEYSALTLAVQTDTANIDKFGCRKEEKWQKLTVHVWPWNGLQDRELI